MRYSLTSHLLPLTSKKPLTSPKSACVNKFPPLPQPPHNATPSPSANGIFFFGLTDFSLWPTSKFSFATAPVQGWKRRRNRRTFPQVFSQFGILLGEEGLPISFSLFHFFTYDRKVFHFFKSIIYYYIYYI